MLPAIHLERIHGYYNLFIDGKKIECFCSGSKKYWTKYLKNRFDIDLRTDPRISKNFKEYETRKVSEKNGQVTYIKRVLQPTTTT